MIDTLADRQKNYEVPYEYIITRRLPIIIRVEGRNFGRICRNLKKPYEPLLLEAFVNTALSMISEMDGSIFCYSFSDQLIFVLRNDQNFISDAWYNNKVQDIVSIVSSLCTYYFHQEVVKTNLELLGPTIFRTKIFALPSITEVVNHLIWKQQQCIRNAINKSTQFILNKEYGKKEASKKLNNKTHPEKIKLLQETGIDFIQEYANSFRLGVGLYKIPLLSKNNKENQIKKKWRINWDLPDLLKERDFITNIILNGSDVLRAVDNLEV